MRITDLRLMHSVLDNLMHSGLISEAGRNSFAGDANLTLHDFSCEEAKTDGMNCIQSLSVTIKIERVT